ncbi:integral membrane protein [Moniliophthora roreri]|uniref:Uncharacterized protein n=1 Tax=Moniliophthora roreri TaxID=221103 RepID=A0A0W0G3S7_MONRR|nr:integral membrane protein [Moniliophthora roreri]
MVLKGAVSIGLGAESSSRSLVFFGIQSGIEVISATIVVWRFWNVALPGEERSRQLTPKELRVEKIATIGIGLLLIALALATEATSIFGLATHDEPTTSNASLIVSASALVLMVAIWLPKRYLARALNSSAMQGETQCSLSCIQITVVLFAGALIFKLWHGGWWVDSATSIVLGLLFGWEGWKMLRWATSPSFDGGCCDHCHNREDNESGAVEVQERYKDLCDCCGGSEVCQTAGECKCPAPNESSESCCMPVNVDGNKCCTHEYVAGRPPVRSQTKPTEASELPSPPPTITESQGDPAGQAKPKTSCCSHC